MTKTKVNGALGSVWGCSKYVDLTDRISFSKYFDLASQNKALKDPGQVYIAKTINIRRFWADLGSILGAFCHIGGLLGAIFTKWVEV